VKNSMPALESKEGEMMKPLSPYGVLAILILLSLAGCATHRDVVMLEERMEASEHREQTIQEQVTFLDSLFSEQTDLLYSLRAELRTGLETVARQMEAVSEIVKYGDEGEYSSGPVIVSTPGQTPGEELLVETAEDEAPVVREGTLKPGEKPAEEEPAVTGEAPEIQKRALYDTAYLDMHRGNYELAIQGFRMFIESDFREELEDNAQYWTGECYYAMGKLDEAISEFQRVVDEYPRGNKVPSALFKIGKCYYELNDTEEASRYFQSVIGGYPHSEEANLAREYLSDLR